MTRICAVIPAAGVGSRLGLGPHAPKLLVEIAPGVTVWDVLRGRLSPHVEGVHVVVSPTGEPLFRPHAVGGGDAAVSVSVQVQPRGMGDAIFGAAGAWSSYDAVLVVWGDQVNLSADTVARVVAAHAAGTQPRRFTLPLTPMADPYVEYLIDTDGRLVEVRQSREGDVCTPGGLSDVGMFLLATDGLLEAWSTYLAGAPRGTATHEVNFIPFLPFLSATAGWPLAVVPVDDADEARGVNTPDDLEFARRSYRG